MGSYDPGRLRAGALAAGLAVGLTACVTQAFAASVPEGTARLSAAQAVSTDVPYVCMGATRSFPVTLDGPSAAATAGVPFPVAWGVGTSASDPLTAPSTIPSGGAHLTGELAWSTAPVPGASPTPTATDTPTVGDTATASPAATPTATDTPAVTPTVGDTGTDTPTATPTATDTPAVTPTVGDTGTDMPGDTVSSTPGGNESVAGSTAAIARAEGPANTVAMDSGSPIAVPSMTATITPSAEATLALTAGAFTVNLDPSPITCSPAPGATPASLAVTVGPSADATATPTDTSSAPAATVTVTETSPAPTVTATVTATSSTPTATATVTATTSGPTVTATSTVQVRVTPVGAAQTGEAPGEGAPGTGWIVFGLLTLAGTALCRVVTRRAAGGRPAR
ncbi:hypothetical protein [Sphaerisporangium fuscum]|uniref:hypothetical protein n=1 Tax=Sphaerisporangium fuscum TaxID=2835868 RepID=UPI001BDD0C20|nr:hypothetical protein [Sphaerisporangium fuscum]